MRRKALAIMAIRTPEELTFWYCLVWLLPPAVRVPLPRPTRPSILHGHVRNVALAPVRAACPWSTPFKLFIVDRAFGTDSKPLAPLCPVDWYPDYPPSRLDHFKPPFNPHPVPSFPYHGGPFEQPATLQPKRPNQNFFQGGSFMCRVEKINIYVARAAILKKWGGGSAS